MGEGNGNGRRIRVLGDRLLVRRDKPTDVSAGGVLLAPSAQRAAMRGTVIALGTGKVPKTGERRNYTVAVGDRVLFSPNLGEEWQGGPLGRGEIEWPGVGPVVVLREADLIGVDESPPGEQVELHLLPGRRAGRLRGEVGRILRGAEMEG